MSDAQSFTPRRVSIWRALWRSRAWIAAPLAVFLIWTFQTDAFVPVYVKTFAAVGAAGVLVWRGPMALSMWRAGSRGDVRQARVTGRRTSAVTSNGVDLELLQWTDAIGQAGESRPSPPDRLPPAGSRIIVYADPSTGRTWWEEDL